MKALLRKLIPLETRMKFFRFVNSIFFALCRLFPVRNRVFFYTIRSDGELLENIKAVYDGPDCKKVVFAKKLPHPQRVQPKICFYLLTSKVIVTDDYVRYMRSVKLRKKQRLVQLWHAGGAFKCFGLDAPSKLSREQELATHSQYTAVIVTGEECKKYYAGAFGVDENICLPLGLPRTDRLFHEKEKMRQAVFQRHPELKNKKIYLYCPTFREENGEKKVYDPKISWNELNGSLGEDEIFIIRRHPIMDYELTDKNYERIIDLSSEPTTELTAAADVMITDYSSVIYDACLLGVPCVFYCPDYREYERNFYLKFPQDLPGELITDGAELLDGIRKTKQNPPLERIEKFVKGQVGACDGHSTERVVSLIEKLLVE